MFYALVVLLFILLPIIPWAMDLLFNESKSRNFTKFLIAVHFYLLMIMFVYLTYIQMQIVEILKSLK